MGAMLKDVMGRKVAVTENGKTRRVTGLEGMMHRLRSEALRGDKAAIKILLPWYERYAEGSEGTARIEDLLPEDLEILARFADGANAGHESASALPRADSEPSVEGDPANEPNPPPGGEPSEEVEQ